MAIRITQAGVALTVGIIGVIALIIGGLFYVKQNGEQARRQEAIEIAERTLQSQSESKSGDQSKGDDNADSRDTNPDAKDTNGTKDASGTKDTQGTRDTQGTPGAGESTPTPGALPETGPGEAIASLVAIGALTYAVAAFWRSRAATGRIC